jgi:hypothetical protein
MYVCWYAYTHTHITHTITHITGAGGRLWGAGAYLPQLTLYGVTIWSAVVLFQGSDPF